MTVAVFGSINMDVTAYMDRLPQPGETLHGRDYKLGLGGKGANQAVAARRLGSEVAFIARLGADDFAAAAARELASYDVDRSLILNDAGGATGIAIINVGESGENFISLIGGSNLRVDTSDVERGRAALGKAQVLLLQLEVPLAASLAAAAVTRASGGMVILDPAPAPANGLARETLAAVDLITPNETETAQILGWRPSTLQEGLKAARELRGAGVAGAIVKLGARGLAVASANGEGMIEAFKVAAIDTVAAGDCFNGGLANALERGLPILEAARFAAACGALSTTKKGAAAAAPTRAEVEAFLAER
ncbi:MAG: ribokinase [Rhizobiales bacterium]|nr:ribokinase [Hyphomicrobiales bacterium]MBI3674290.1 ribokinase [Hyphomicrobiales bacterium]